MRQNMVRLSFDIPEDEHTMLKTACAQSRLAIKDFVHAMILKGIQEFKDDEFKKRLKESIQQAKKGKIRIISPDELDKMFENADG
jgi:hypothetical protein